VDVISGDTLPIGPEGAAVALLAGQAIEFGQGEEVVEAFPAGLGLLEEGHARERLVQVVAGGGPIGDDGLHLVEVAGVAGEAIEPGKRSADCEVHLGRRSLEQALVGVEVGGADEIAHTLGGGQAGLVAGEFVPFEEGAHYVVMAPEIPVA